MSPDVRSLLQALVVWWERDAPDRSLNEDDAHEMGNIAAIAKGLLHPPAVRDEGRDHVAVDDADE